MTKKQYERPIVIKQYSALMNKFGSSPVAQPKSEIDGVPVKTLVEKYDSPVFVFSEKQIRENQRRTNRIFKSRYPKIKFAWSYKTNYLNAICSIFHQEGSWAEVVSGFEYEKARSLGVEGKYIIFNGPYKSDDAIRKAIIEESKIHIDHFDELYKVIEIAEDTNAVANVAIRVNMDVGIYPKWDRFGFNFENGEAMNALHRIAVNKNMKLVGLHTHIGTYMMSAEAYRAASSKLVLLANELKSKYSIVLDYIDMGGGLPSNNTLHGQYLPADQVLPSLEQFADAITAPLFDIKYPAAELPTLILESGRALIDDAGYLISKVIANKRLSDGKRAIIIDGGVNILFTSFWYKHKISPAQHGAVYTENSALYGPLCMNIDCIREDVVLPSLKKGEYVVVHYVGAYNVTQWMQFITLRPNVILITEEGGTEVIRETESIEYLMKPEKLPQRLGNFTLSD